MSAWHVGHLLTSKQSPSNDRAISETSSPPLRQCALIDDDWSTQSIENLESDAPLLMLLNTKIQSGFWLHWEILCSSADWKPSSAGHRAIISLSVTSKLGLPTIV